MKECRLCGFPVMYARFFDWRSDGIMTSNIEPRIPAMFVEVDEWESVFKELSDTLGIPIDHIVIDAQKQVGKDLYEMVRSMYFNINVKRVPVNGAIRPQWLGRLIVWGMGKYISGLGAGTARVERYEAGRCLTLRFAEPCLIPMIVGNCLGIYESIEEMPGSDAEYRFDGEDLVVHMTPAAEAEEIEERFYFEPLKEGSGPLAYERCSACGVPVRVSHTMRWNINRGIIRNSFTGRREEMMAVQSVGAVLRELERELGTEIDEILYSAQKRRSLAGLASERVTDADSFWRDLLEGLALRGMGYPSRFTDGGDSIEVEIDNAYSTDLFAAKLAAGLEKVTGKDSSIDWKTRERDRGVYTIACC